MINLNSRERKVLTEISSTYYMKPIIKRINSQIKSNSNIKLNWLNVFDYLYEILKDSRSDVEKLLDNRLDKNIIKNKDQARRSIVGNAFSKSIIYIFLINKVHENIPNKIYITSQGSVIPDFDKLTRIKIQDEFQKPDMDIVIYSEDNYQDYILISLKTSLRERAAQTYKWKLLIDIALYSPELRERYGISYSSSKVPIICFATTNFYNEINNPQQRGILKFFDRVFIARQIDHAFAQSDVCHKPPSGKLSTASPLPSSSKDHRLS
ncbi:BsaWI family type II restriction enzyme [Synechococcus sp. PCC 6716]|nr:BsaWI family type II restriction enzyme [Synechococcus sp. PCC 6716]